MLTLKKNYLPLLKKTGFPAKTTFIFQKFGLYTEKLLLDAPSLCCGLPRGGDWLLS
jgi:hypothetical protein